MTTYDVTAIGEALLRLSVPAGSRLRQAQHLELCIGGAESNVLAALAQLGRRCGFGGALLAAPPGQMAAHSLQAMGIDLTPAVWMPEGRMGAYYVEFAAPPRPIQVTYDRAHSCAAMLTPAQVNWDALLDARLLHITGITAALSPSAYAVAQAAAQHAAAQGVAFSFDVNYRSKLWPPQVAAAQLRPLMAQARILFCKRQDALTLFGISGEVPQVLQALHHISAAEVVVCTDGADGVYALYAGEVLHRPSLPVQILDRMGAGDALAAGVLHGYLNGDVARGLGYGAALAALALSQYGDMVITSPEEVEALLINPAHASIPQR